MNSFRIAFSSLFIFLFAVGCSYSPAELEARDNAITINGERFSVFMGSDGHEYIKERTHSYNIYVHSGSCRNSIHIPR